MESVPKPTGNLSSPKEIEARTNADLLTQSTCQMIVTAAAELIDGQPKKSVVTLVTNGGVTYGRQFVINASEKDGLLNVCRVTVFNPDLNEEGEVTRIEYEHDKETKFGRERAYSVQSVRRRGADLRLLENFLASAPEQVREADFRDILSDTYGQQTVLATLRDWTRFRKWQLSSK